MKEVFILIDADSLIYKSCVCKKEEDEQGFIRDFDEATGKFDEGLFYILNYFEDNYPGMDAHHLLFLEGRGNVRRSIVTSYKEKRRARELPPLLNDLREWVVEHHPAFVCVNIEADDCIGATWYKYHEEMDLIISSIDKDLRQLPCTLFDYYFAREEGERIMQITPHEAELNFYRQMLVGDAADEVQGIKGVGAKKAEKLLPLSLSTSSLRPRTYREYVKCYGRNAKLEFLKAYYLMRLPKEGVFIPDLNSYLF